MNKSLSRTDRSSSMSLRCSNRDRLNEFIPRTLLETFRFESLEFCVFLHLGTGQCSTKLPPESVVVFESRYRLLLVLLLTHGFAYAGASVDHVASVSDSEFDAAQNWESYGRTYDEGFYSPLDQINEH